MKLLFQQLCSLHHTLMPGNRVVKPTTQEKGRGRGSGRREGGGRKEGEWEEGGRRGSGRREEGGRRDVLASCSRRKQNVAGTYTGSEGSGSSGVRPFTFGLTKVICTIHSQNTCVQC